MDNTYKKMANELNHLLKTKASVDEIFTLVDRMEKYEKNKYDTTYQFPDLPQK
jgi:hypothetical protein